MGDPTGAYGFGRLIQRIDALVVRLRRLEKQAVGKNPVFASVTSTLLIKALGVRTNTLTNSPVPLYIDNAGLFGVSASTRAKKNIGTDYQVDMTKFLAISLKNWAYINNPSSTGMGPIADDLDAAGLKEFVIYNLDGSIQGVRTDTLLMGLWSAYKQSRAITLARLANQAHQTVNVTSMTALALGGVKNYAITWPTAFADNDYLVVSSVVSTAGVLVAGSTAALVPGSRTTTGCTVQVAAGIALVAGQTLIVEGTHI